MTREEKAFSVLVLVEEGRKVARKSAVRVLWGRRGKRQVLLENSQGEKKKKMAEERTLCIWMQGPVWTLPQL